MHGEQVTTIAAPEWADQQLDKFISLTDLVTSPDRGGRHHRGSSDEIVVQFVLVEPIFDRLIPGWRDALEMTMNLANRQWVSHRTQALRAKAVLASQEEIREKLGDSAPHMTAAALHPWAWEGARSLWQSGHFREAVTAAARKVNAETQNKLNRRDASETKLFQDALSTNAPLVGHPRLRIVADDGSDTYKGTQRGVMAFAEGCYAAIRNPNSHEDGLPELPEHEALEQLSAFSVLARWIDRATVEIAV
ncbi:TIGR02391 family protein [Streptacidiphilus carbonis]|uniref:TIGR02391 family protein n=1 Tax=Streptacidiphilus carbonis TaxID=105422 RepID=UPI0005A73BB7|nr:TIGR02391 family protein [Streptacidiphilus carbonis]